GGGRGALRGRVRRLVLPRVRVETLEHEIDHRDRYPCLFTLGQRLVVLAQPSIPPQPRQRAFYDPPPREHLETLLVGGFPHDFQDPAELLLHPVNEWPPIGAVRPDQRYSAYLAHKSPEDQLGPVTILDIRGMDHHHQQ